MSSLSPRSWAAVGVMAAVVLALQLPFWSWCVEDAGISFAYARSLATGWGPVPYPGAEPVEGYSNPAWVAVLAVAQWAGASPFTVAPMLGLVSVLGALAGVVAAGRARQRQVEALWAGAMLAGHAQLAIWAQSGLENGLFALFLALGVWRLARDDDRAGAALCFLGLALTRPEGLLYAVVAGVGSLGLAWRAGGFVGLRGRAGGWAAAFVAPLLAYHALRFGWFAMELPATFYAKLGGPVAFDWLRWDQRQWFYLARYAVQTGQGIVLPVALLGLCGTKGWRAGAWLGLSLLWAVMMGLVPAEGAATWKVLTVCVVLGAPVLLAVPRRPWLAVVGALGLVGLVFSVRSTGDWMRGFRWLSLTAVPAAVLFGAGLEEARQLGRRAANDTAGWAVAAALAAAVLVPQGWYLVLYTGETETSVEQVRHRGRWYEELADELRLWRRPILVDHDMGGLLWEASDRLDLRDAKGLVDLPMALHGRAQRVVDEVLHDEARELPAFVHLHASTRRALQRRPWFREAYVEVPGIPVSSGVHDGQFVRRDLILGGPWDGRRRIVRYEGFTLTGWRIRSPEVARKSSILLEVGMERPEGGAASPEVVAFLADASGNVAQRWVLEPGYGLLAASSWREGEAFSGAYVLDVGDLKQGWYRLGLYVTDAGQPLPLVRRQPSDEPIEVPTEVLYERGVRIVSRDRMNELATEDRDKSFELGGDGKCRRAEEAWDDAIAHRAGSRDWRRSRIWKNHARLAWCWATRAREGAEALRVAVPEEGDDKAAWEAQLLEAVDDVLRARSWYPIEPAVDRAGAMVGALAWGRATTYQAQGDLVAAQAWYDRAARCNPSLVWARRRSEQLRAERLQLPSARHFWW